MYALFVSASREGSDLRNSIWSALLALAVLFALVWLKQRLTADGELLYAGANMNQHDREKVLQALPPHARIVDVFPTGSECTQVYFALQDGSIWNLWGEQKAVTTARRSEPAKVFDGTYFYNVLTLTDRGELIQSFEGQLTPLFPGAGKIVSFASGHADSLEPFVLAVAERET